MAGYKRFIPEALKRIEEKRAEAERMAEVKREAVYEKAPRLWEIDEELAETMVSLSRAVLKGANIAEELEKIKEENLSLSREKAEILKKHNLTAEDSKPHYSCSICEDRGYVEGNACSCLISLAKTLLYNSSASGAIDKTKTFENFDLSLYPETDENGNPIRERMKTVYEEAMRFADEPYGNLIFIGRTGLGKTHISLAIANRIIDKGASVIYTSAPSMFMRIERERFSKEGDYLSYLEDLIDSELLIIDDLGAEIKTSVTVSALYQIINERLANNKPTIISTNLSVSEISENYEERIASRIFGSFDGYLFKGNDIRRVIKN